jgi:hypothetical protein
LYLLYPAYCAQQPVVVRSSTVCLLAGRPFGALQIPNRLGPKQMDLRTERDAAESERHLSLRRDMSVDLARLWHQEWHTGFLAQVRAKMRD